MPHEKIPDGALIQDRADRLHKVWSRTHQKWREIDTYINQSFQVWPDKFTYRPSFRPSKPASIVNVASDQLIAFIAQVHRNPIGEGTLHQERADRVERAMGAEFNEASLQQTSLPFKTAGKFLGSHGYAVMDGPRAGEIRPKMDEDDFNTEWNPIQIEAPHPSQVLMDPMQKIPQFAIRRSVHFAYELNELTVGKQADKRPVVNVFNYEDPFQEVKVLEYWTRHWHAMKVDGLDIGHTLFVEKNWWGYVPFTHAFSGWGQEVTNPGMSIDPQYLAVGLLDHSLSDFKMLAQLRSTWHNMIMRKGWTPIGVHGDAAEMGGKMDRGEMLEGEKDDLWIVPTPDIPRDIIALEEKIVRDIEEATFVGATRGAKEPGVSTVGQQAMISNASQKKFIVLHKQLGHMGTIIGRNTLRLIVKLGKPISIQGNKLSPADIEKNDTLNVTFEALDPVMLMQQIEQGLRMREAGVLDDQGFWAMARMEDSSGIRRRLLKDEIMRLPEVKLKAMEVVAEEEGMLEFVKAAQARLKAEKEGEQPNPTGQIPNVSQNIRQPLDDQTTKPAPRSA